MSSYYITSRVAHETHTHAKHAYQIDAPRECLSALRAMSVGLVGYMVLGPSVILVEVATRQRVRPDIVLCRDPDRHDYAVVLYRKFVQVLDNFCEPLRFRPTFL